MIPAIVLAAGLSRRIRGVSDELPKPLLEIDGRTVLERNLRWLADEGIEHVLVTLHYRPDAIRSVVGDGRGCGLRVEYEQEERLRGTAGGVRGASPRLSFPLLVVYGDNLLRLDLAAMREAHAASGAAATVALFDPATSLHTGIAGGTVSVDASGRVTGFHEGSSAGRLVNAGVYLLEPTVLDVIPAVPPSDFGYDVFPTMLRAGLPIQGHEMREGWCLGLDTPRSVSRARALIASGKVSLR